MWLTLAKLAAQLIPPEKGAKIVLGCIMGGFAALLLLFAAPLIVLSHLPIGKNTDEYAYYMDAAKQMRDNTGVYVNWQHIMAIDAVLLEQDYSTSSFNRAYGYYPYFIRVESEPVDCPEGENNDEEEVPTICYEDFYYSRSFTSTLNMLVANGILRSDQIEDVSRYIIYDATPYIATPPVQLPEGWVPTASKFQWPVINTYNVSSPFGTRMDPFTFTISEHTGIDIPASTGTTVQAAQGGTVIYASDRGTAGNSIIIKHPQDMETRYYHLHRIYVRNGQVVSKAQDIGEVGNTGRSTGPHLHFEVRIGGRPVDPLPYYR